MPRSLLCLALLVPAALSAQHVTARMKIEIDSRLQTARQINGRWWSEDNRELTRTNARWLYTLSKTDPSHFRHHRPFHPAGIASLSRASTFADAQATLGEPNGIFPFTESSALWTYYSADGQRLQLHFAQGLIWNAQHQLRPGDMPRDVPHLAVRNAASAATGFPTAGNTTAAVSQPAPPPQPQPRRLIAADLAQSVTTGTTRAALLAALGPPASTARVQGDQLQETFTYYLDSSETLQIRLVDGIVARPPVRRATRP